MILLGIKTTTFYLSILTCMVTAWFKMANPAVPEDKKGALLLNHIFLSFPAPTIQHSPSICWNKVT